MEAVDYLMQWNPWLLAIIPTGAAMMVGYQAVRKTFATDEAVISDCKTKIKNVIKGAIIGMCMSGLVNVIRSFYM